jgi:hypothetical protein
LGRIVRIIASSIGGYRIDLGAGGRSGASDLVWGFI